MNHIGTQTLETPRLILRRFTEDDAELMYRNWASEDAVTRYLTWPTHKNADVSRWVLTDWVKHYAEPAYYQWAIVPKALSEPIGSIAVVNIRQAVDCAELGYCMGSRWWGQGIMPEAGEAVLKFLFQEVGFRRICAAHATENQKSGRVMQKLGMKFEGIFRQNGLCNQGIIDEAWYAILKEEYEERGKDA